MIFGDLNFRPALTLDLDQCFRLIEQDDIQSLQYYDEFIQFMSQPKANKGLLRNYKEGTITFGPSYKYLMKTNEYDVKRMPSYTDRILFESVHDMPQKNPMMNIFYGKVDYDLSDHKPITGLFEAKIKVIDPEKRQVLIRKVTDKHAEAVADSGESRKQAFLNQIE